MTPPSDPDSINPAAESSSYIPADRDTEFLQRDELRPLRIGIELLKPELIQREQGIQSTIVVFGSARLQEPAAAEACALPRGGGGGSTPTGSNTSAQGSDRSTTTRPLKIL